MLVDRGQLVTDKDGTQEQPLHWSGVAMPRPMPGTAGISAP